MIRLSLALLLASSLVACRGASSDTPAPNTAPDPTASDEGSSDPAEGSDEAAPAADALASWAPIPAGERAYPGPCALRTQAVDGDGNVQLAQTTLLYDQDGTKRIEFTVSGTEASAVLTTYNDRDGHNVSQVTAGGLTRDATSRRRNQLNEDGTERLREHFGLRAGQDYRVAYRYDGEQRHGDLDVHFDGFIDSRTDATLHPSGELLREDFDNNGDDVFERRIVNTFDERGNNTVREEYADGSDTPSSRTERTFDAHNNLLGHVTDLGVDGTRDVAVTPNYGCFEPYEPSETCAETPTIVQDLGLQVCAQEYALRGQVELPLVAIDDLFEPVRGLYTIGAGPDGYSLDGTPMTDLDTLASTLLTQEATRDPNEGPITRYRIAIAPETPMSAVHALFTRLEAHRARRLLVVFDTRIALEADARLAGPPTGALCPAVGTAIEACADSCLGCIEQAARAAATCGCAAAPRDVAAALSARYAPARPQTGWSVRLETESHEPVVVAPNATWAASYPQVLAANPNSLWITLSEAE